MFSFTRTIYFPFLAALSLALVGGCKISGQKPERPVPATPITPIIPSPSETNKPSQPPVTLPPDSGDSMVPNILVWDTVSKEYRAKTGELKAPFTFNLTNVSSGPVVIYDTSTTCDCTVASLPSKPWTLTAGASGKIEATIDLTKKTSNVVTNEIIVFTSQGNRRLKVKAIVSDSK
ncbi:MAG TPA: DUF1573 domain-containing protein [Verrucomicrobiae bacterium]|jgi:hypothetical protein|nr:DUF1573 domain-containing protein [Verrucomicrobiae bacterium]